MVTRVSGASGATIYCYDNNGNQISAGDGNPNSVAADQRFISYAVHDKPLSVRTSGPNGRLTRYQYGPNREIVKRLDGPNASFTDTEVDYVGGVEIYYRPNQGSTTERREYQRHLGNYLIISLKFERQNGSIVRSSSRSYRFEDKLGSIDVLTDANGNVRQRMSFDVWGERRSDVNWSAYSPAQIVAFNADKTRKGFTGHEHLDQANLIHMGGRIYDPRIGRFLSADPLIQAPHFSQSYNRYSYVLNNPMNYVDPSGYSWISDNWRAIAAIVISFYVPGAYAAILGVAKTHVAVAILTGMTAGAVQTGTLKGALIGGFSAGMFHGIGSYFDDVGSVNAGDWAFEGSKGDTARSLSSAGRAAKIAAHASAGGVMRVLQGGKFGHGFASAGFGEAVGPTVARLAGNSAARQFIAGTIVGGTAARLAGGKFANGAVTAAFSYAFNQMAHNGQENPAPQKARINPEHVDRFFDDLYEPIKQMAADLGVHEDWLLGLSSYESGWYNAHNRALNNPFGLTRAGGNNLRFDTVQDAIELWSRTFGPQVRNASTAQEFVTKLQGGPRVYNSVNPEWSEKVLMQVRTIQIRKAIWTQGDKP